MGYSAEQSDTWNDTGRVCDIMVRDTYVPDNIQRWTHILYMYDKVPLRDALRGADISVLGTIHCCSYSFKIYYNKIT